MTALVQLEGVAAALPQANINTDIIAPLVRGGSGAQPVGLRPAEELAQRLFGPWRYDASGRENPRFVLNRGPFRQARFLIAGPNFACGSSRETAATMLHAFGIRCVIAPSFGQIFHDNCLRNHMLPLQLPQEVVDQLISQAESGHPFRLDLRAMSLQPPQGDSIGFTLPLFRHEMLLQGLDEVAVTLARSAQIDAYQAASRAARPWDWL